MDVRCIAIYQDPTPEMWVTKIGVQKWDGLRWSDVFVVDEAWSGNWMRAPRQLEQWRLLPTVPLAGAWKVAEVEFFPTATCETASKYTKGYVIASGTASQDASTKSDNAFDGDLSTSWQGNYAVTK